MANDPMRSTQESVMPARKAVAMTTTNHNGTTNNVPPTRGIIISADLAVDCYFADEPSTKRVMTLLGGLVYPFEVIAVKFDSGTCHALY
jgi:hypothetical protein